VDASAITPPGSARATVLERLQIGAGGRKSARSGVLSCSALKVWKNSSSVRVLRCLELDVVDSSTSISRKRALKRSARPSAAR
jgi:hypothetical protein